MNEPHFINGYKPAREWPVNESLNITDLVKDNNRVRFDYYRNGIMYYTVVVPSHIYRFPVPIDDIGNATLRDYDKAITFMRYIRIAIENKTIVEIEMLMA